jgi:hypothetical protein
MISRKSFLVAIGRMMLITSLVIVLAGCGGSHSTDQNLSQSSFTNTPFPNGNRIFTDIKGLHVQSLNGFGCAFDPGLLRNIVLSPSPTSRFKYDVSELRQMTKFLQKIPDLVGWERLQIGHPFSISPLMSSMESPPMGLSWIAGGRVDCGVEYQITNTGEATIQIPTVDLRLTKPAYLNNYQYHFIDLCTVLSQPINPLYGCAPNSGASGGDCSVYHASIDLNATKEGSIFSAAVSERDEKTNTQCPTLTLDPGKSIELWLDVVPSNPPTNLIYPIVPEFTLETKNGSYVLQPSQLASTLTFADDNQISCYGLQSDTFVLESPIPNTSWCT